jgi:pimeloyl-ACP methyl ester carboxylesterase
MSAAASLRGVTADGVHYGRRGSGPAIVLLHGWCLNRELWMYEEERLRATHTVITPDLPGFGLSSDLDGPYDLDRHATAVQALLEELDLADVVVVGFAFGAAVAMTLAARDDSRLSGLVLIGVPSAAHSPYDRMPRAIRRDWPEFARLSARAICKGPISDATLDWLARMFGATALPVALETVGVLGRFEPADVAGNVKVRSLFVHGELDDVVPVKISETCAVAMVDAHVNVIPESGHLVPIDRAKDFAAAVDEFLAGVAERA